MFHDDVHRIRHFAAVFPAVDAAGHGDGKGNPRPITLYQNASC